MHCLGFVFAAGLIQPELLSDGQVCVDMGEPILEGAKVPTTLAPTQGSTVLKAPLSVEGKTYSVTCVSMGNPHAIIYSADGKDVEVSAAAWSGCMGRLHGAAAWGGEVR